MYKILYTDMDAMITSGANTTLMVYSSNPEEENFVIKKWDYLRIKCMRGNAVSSVEGFVCSIGIEGCTLYCEDENIPMVTLPISEDIVYEHVENVGKKIFVNYYKSEEKKEEWMKNNITMKAAPMLLFVKNAKAGQLLLEKIRGWGVTSDMYMGTDDASDPEAIKIENTRVAQKFRSKAINAIIVPLDAKTADIGQLCDVVGNVDFYNCPLNMYEYISRMRIIRQHSNPMILLLTLAEDLNDNISKEYDEYLPEASIAENVIASLEKEENVLEADLAKALNCSIRKLKSTLDFLKELSIVEESIFIQAGESVQKYTMIKGNLPNMKALKGAVTMLRDKKVTDYKIMKQYLNK